MWHKGARHIGRTYLLGFVLSLILTLGAYAAAVYDLVSANMLVPLVLALACLQFVVQVLGFLHVSGAGSSRDRLIALGSTAVIILVLVLGSMWIMITLDERMMMPDSIQMERYMQRQQGI